MPIKDKIITGGLTIRDVKPEITSEGLARSAGFAIMDYRNISETMDELEAMYNKDELTKDPTQGIAKMYARLQRTRTQLDNFIEEYQD